MTGRRYELHGYLVGIGNQFWFLSVAMPFVLFVHGFGAPRSSAA